MAIFIFLLPYAELLVALAMLYTMFWCREKDQTSHTKYFFNFSMKGEISYTAKQKRTLIFLDTTGRIFTLNYFNEAFYSTRNP